MEDNEILRLFNERDEDALRAVSEKFGRLCGSIARNILHNSEDVEECLNDTYLKAWESIPPAKPKALAAYLAKIAKNISLNRYKSYHREKRGGGEAPLVFEELAELEPFAEGSVEGTAERKELLAEINRFLGKLPEHKRVMFVRRYWYCESVSELARFFGMTDNNVSATLSRTRAELKKHLKKRGYDNG
ncbi:MAG: sigma-70 family RNA polymerase sigma factor [Lachnospiraceae bacterium]|nr:sigma-70 family RNA polymerase sigma factor [Ruminococcus sp.]MCM1274739.1 sigma-70 family RNA polymerase sigma factor [Lachnospiraceae bacterium]